MSSRNIQYFPQIRKVLAFLDGVHPKNRVEIPPQWKISIYEVKNMPTIIGEFPINYEMTTLMET